MKLTAVAKAFPALSYWARLPGFAALCGASAGICLARAALLLAPENGFGAPILAKSLFAATVLAGTGGALCGRQALRALLFAACGFALFGGSELRLRDFYRQMESATENHQIMTLTLRVSGPVAEAYGGRRFRAKVVRAGDAEVDRLLRGKTLQCASKAPVPAYGAVTVQGRYSAPRAAAGPLGYDQREHFAVNNIRGGFSVSRVLSADSGGAAALPEKLSHRLRAGVHRVINMSQSPETRAVLHAAFLDEKEYLTDRQKTVFRKSGIVHLLAISGFHSAMLYAAFFTLLGLFAMPPRARSAAAIAALWGYLFFIGFIPSLFRSTIMATFFCASTVLQRKNHAVHTLGISGFFWLCLSPHSLFAPGFQLSFAATAGILLLPGIFDGATKAINSRIRNKPAEFIAGKILAPLWMSVAATAATAPPLLYHFGMMSFYGIIYNIIAVPLMSAAMWAFFAALALSPVGFLAKAAVWCADKALSLVTWLAGFSESVPFSEIVMPNVTPLQLAVMSVFMVGMCAVKKGLRGAYALRAGGAAMLVFSVAAFLTSANRAVENLEFRGKNATVSVVVHPDNRAWIIAQGRRNEIRSLRVREIEPLLYRKKIRDVPLLLIDENAEEEAHDFAFSTGLAPRTVVIRNRRGNDRYGYADRYTIINARQIRSADGSCGITISPDGKAEFSAARRQNEGGAGQ